MAQSNVFELGEQEYEERLELMASEEYNVEPMNALLRNAVVAQAEEARLNKFMFGYFHES